MFSHDELNPQPVSKKRVRESSGEDVEDLTSQRMAAQHAYLEAMQAELAAKAVALAAKEAALAAKADVLARREVEVARREVEVARREVALVEATLGEDVDVELPVAPAVVAAPDAPLVTSVAQPAPVVAQHTSSAQQLQSPGLTSLLHVASELMRHDGDGPATFDGQRGLQQGHRTSTRTSYNKRKGWGRGCRSRAATIDAGGLFNEKPGSSHAAPAAAPAVTTVVELDDED